MAKKFIRLNVEDDKPRLFHVDHILDIRPITNGCQLQLRFEVVVVEEDFAHIHDLLDEQCGGVIR